MNFPVILLAAGQSQRMGTPKGLVKIGGIPWLEAQLKALAIAGAGRCVIVLGHAHEEYVRALPWLAAPGVRERVAYTVALNPRPELGQFSSIQVGARSVLGDAAAFVLPVDVPCPDRMVWDALESTLVAPVRACFAEHQGKGGHPVLLSQAILADLAVALLDTPDSRLDVRLHKLAPGQLERVSVADARVIMNINEPDDWKALSGPSS